MTMMDAAQVRRTPLPARASKYSSIRKVAWPCGMLCDDNIAPDVDDDEAMLRLFGATRPRPPGTPDGGGIIAMVGSGQAYVESKQQQQQQECGDDVRARSMRRWQHRREAETDGEWQATWRTASARSPCCERLSSTNDDDDDDYDDDDDDRDHQGTITFRRRNGNVDAVLAINKHQPAGEPELLETNNRVSTFARVGRELAAGLDTSPRLIDASCRRA